MLHYYVLVSIFTIDSIAQTKLTAWMEEWKKPLELREPVLPPKKEGIRCLSSGFFPSQFHVHSFLPVERSESLVKAYVRAGF